MSPGVRPSVPRINGRGCPRSIPTLTPFAPGNVPNRLSNVRFSLIRKTTCLIGNSVSSDDASKTSGSPLVITLGLGDPSALGEAGDAGATPSHAAATRPSPASTAVHRSSRARGEARFGMGWHPTNEARRGSRLRSGRYAATSLLGRDQLAESLVQRRERGELEMGRERARQRTVRGSRGWQGEVAHPLLGD